LALRRQIHDVFVFGVEHRAVEQYESVRAPSGDCGERDVEIAGIFGSYELKLPSQYLSCIFGLVQQTFRGTLAVCIGMPKHSDAGNFGNSFFEQPHTLRGQFWTEKSGSRNIPSWSRQAGHQLITNRISHRRYDDGDRAGRFFSRTSRRRTHHDDYINVHLHQLSGELAETIRSPIAIEPHYRNVLSVGVTEFPKAVVESEG